MDYQDPLLSDYSPLNHNEIYIEYIGFAKYFAKIKMYFILIYNVGQLHEVKSIIIIFLF